MEKEKRVESNSKKSYIQKKGRELKERILFVYKIN